MRFAVTIDRDEDGVWVIECPAIPGCVSQGKTKDEAMNSAGRFNIRGIPTLLVFKDGQVVEQIVGAVPKDQIMKALDRHLGQ